MLANNQFIIAFAVGMVVGLIACVLGIMYLHKKMKQEVPGPVQTLREVFPNNGKMWTDEEKAGMLLGYEYGMGIVRLCEEFGRPPSAILSMLLNHQRVYYEAQDGIWFHKKSRTQFTTEAIIENYMRARLQ